jgi:hypothetical protein
LAVIGEIDDIAGMAQGARQAIGQQGIVFDQEDTHRMVRKRSG